MFGSPEPFAGGDGQPRRGAAVADPELLLYLAEIGISLVAVGAVGEMFRIADRA